MEHKSIIARLSPLLWLAAFVCALYPVNDWQLGLFAATIALLFSWAYLRLSPGVETGWPLAKTPTLILAGLFWLLVMLSAFWSEIKPISLMGFCFFTVMPLSFFIGVMTGEDSYFRTIAKSLAVIFAMLSVWAVIQFFFLNVYFQGQARHPLADPSSLAALFSLALFCAAGWLVSDRPQAERRMACALSILLVCGIISTVARGPVFAFIPGAILFAILLWPRVKASWRALLLIALAGLAFYGLTLTGAQKEYDLGKRLSGTIAMSGDVSNNRLEIWSSTVEMIRDRPLLGTGIGTYFLYYPEYRHTADASGTFLAHNDPLQFWAELGILGPILFYGFALAAAMRTFRALKLLPPASPDRLVIAAIFAAMVSMAVESHVGFNHFNLTILMINGFLLSVWYRHTAIALAEPVILTAMPANTPAAAARLLLALPFLMIGWLFLSIVGGEHMANRARDSLFSGDMTEFADDINAADHISLGLNFRAYLFAVNVPMSILETQGAAFDDEQKKKLYEQVTGYMNRVLAVNPRDATAYYYLARVQQHVPAGLVPANTPTPEEYYRKAIAYDPTHIGARLGLLKLYQDAGKSKYDQLAIMEPGAGFYYTTPLATTYFAALARLFLETGNYVKAQDTMQRIAEFEKRSAFSARRQATSIPQALGGGDETLASP